MKIKKVEVDKIVLFNGLVFYYNQYGGFSIRGFIDLKRNYIGLYYDLKNNCDYNYIGYKIYEKNKRKVI